MLHTPRLYKSITLFTSLFVSLLLDYFWFRHGHKFFQIFYSITFFVHEVSKFTHSFLTLNLLPLRIHSFRNRLANTQPYNSLFCSIITTFQSVISIFQFIIASYTLYGILSLYLFAVSLMYCSLYSLYFWNASSGVLNVPSLMFLPFTAIHAR